MNRSILQSIALGLIVAFASLPLYAQTATSTSNKSDDTVAKVQTDGGVIMLSDGGEFQTALPDERVTGKERLMVSEDSAATIVYDNGCDKKYDKPGIYEISSTCVLPFAMSEPSQGLLVAGAVVGTAILVLAFNDDEDTDSRPPISR